VVVELFFFRFSHGRINRSIQRIMALIKSRHVRCSDLGFWCPISVCCYVYKNLISYFQISYLVYVG
jgi:hypothetical protein